jgi:general stress protein 26
MVDKKQALTLMDEAEVVYLATVSAKGPRIRALVNLRRSDQYPEPSKIARTDDFAVYLATSLASDKIRDIRANPAVAVYYCKPQSFHGVTVSGRAELVDDPRLKEALWSDDWRIYWPDGPSNADYIVVRITPEEIRGWWESQAFTIEPA